MTYRPLSQKSKERFNKSQQEFYEKHIKNRKKIDMTTDELLNKLPSHIGNHRLNEHLYVIEEDGDDVQWLYLHNDGKDWLASYGVEGEFLCMGQLDNGNYDCAFSYGKTPNEALKGLYDWCVNHGFITQENDCE